MSERQDTLSAKPAALSRPAIPAPQTPPIWRSFVSGGLGSVIGCLLCHPFDVIKVRLQIQGEGGMLTGPQGSMLLRIVKAEGMAGLTYDFGASTNDHLDRASTYQTVKIGMYDVLKRQVFQERADNPISLPKKISAGLLAGAIGAGLANPMDLIMVRMLADRAKPVHQRNNYGNAFKLLMQLKRNELFIGFVPNVARATIVTASQLVTYDQLKFVLLKHTHLRDDMPVHIAASFLAGVVTGVISNPMDVMKTRIMNTHVQYAGLRDCIVSAAKHEGIKGFYKGCATTIVRQCAYTMGTFVVMEQIHRWMKYMDQSRYW